MNAAVPTAVLLVHLLHAATGAAASDALAAHLEPAAADTIEDIAIDKDGMVRGRVFSGTTANRPVNLRVKFARDGRVVAVAAVDREGRFAVGNLPAGFYCVVVEGSESPAWRFCRLWYAEIAPPSARAEIASLPISGPIVRGQRSSPFPIMSLRQAAVATAVVGGAIAAPAIYHNARQSNRVPASP